ncbi:Pre protein translocase subunit Sec66-domain-containing protein [Infundibulicybe gibba]|nr:Pre protein translocase subunit Sec66-domain-containing protein [Infundibulicybe gibba]
MASVLVPVAYIIIVFGGLFVFSYFYRKHTSSQTQEPYFPTHAERNIYVTLLQKTDPPASDSILKSALVRRAMTDVHRVLRIREDKPALQNLLQKGSIGDDLWNSLLTAEKELEAEIMEVVAEANSFVEGWGQVIFPTANEMIANEKMRATFERTVEVKSELGPNEIWNQGQRHNQYRHVRIKRVKYTRQASKWAYASIATPTRERDLERWRNGSKWFSQPFKIGQEI